ncbi:MAG TPA: hypothetical protein VM779_03360, partial [Thermoanaerobaculia bacterium]|nr:hypothetical protein [Thermoanaerobaculia bacterium]
MSSTTPTELNAATIISNLEADAYPRQTLETIARGFLPLPQEDLIAVLAYLSRSSDEEIAELAQGSLGDIPTRIVHAFASNENARPDHLALLVLASRDRTILEALIRNRAVADEVVAELAGRADGPVQEVIVINHARLIRSRFILDALLANPHLTADARRRALEVREEFFEKKARLLLLAEENAPPEVAEKEAELFDQIQLDAIRDLLDQAEAERIADAKTGAPDLTEHEAADDTKRSVWSRLSTMTVAEKVQLAFKGNRTVRTILVRERNRLISNATMRNPRMTESEVEAIAGMRNVEDEVLRLIGLRRDWTSKYNIILALARNPKAPLGVVLPLINRLNLRDL